MSEYDGKQFVGIDLHRQRSVIVRQTDTGERLAAVRIVNDPRWRWFKARERRPEPGGAARGDLWMVLGSRHPAGSRSDGASCTSFGGGCTCALSPDRSAINFARDRDRLA